MKLTLSILLLLVLSICDTSYATPVQWATGSGGNGHWYEAVAVPSTIGWQSAASAATASAGYLATVTSAAENNFVFAVAAQVDGCWVIWGGWALGPWLGSQQAAGSSEPNGGWSWVTGETWSYTHWAPGQPGDALGIENSLHYAGLNETRQATWNDVSENSALVGYVVEWDANPVPEPASAMVLLAGMGVLASRRRR